MLPTGWWFRVMSLALGPWSGGQRGASGWGEGSALLGSGRLTLGVGVGRSLAPPALSPDIRKNRCPYSSAELRRSPWSAGPRKGASLGKGTTLGLRSRARAPPGGPLCPSRRGRPLAAPGTRLPRRQAAASQGPRGLSRQAPWVPGAQRGAGERVTPGLVTSQPGSSCPKGPRPQPPHWAPPCPVGAALLSSGSCSL